MQIPKQATRCLTAFSALLALLLCSGCITISEKAFTNSVAYTPVPAPAQIDATATLSVSDSLAPDQRAVWKKWLNNDKSIENYLRAFEKSVRNDFATCGLFTQIVTDPSIRADYAVTVDCLESHPSDFRLKITVTATETATGAQVSVRTRDHSMGKSMFEVKINERLAGYMALAKADLTADLQAITRQKLEKAQQAQAELLTNANFSDLLVSSERSITLARARNRALIAAKTRQLPDILRNWKTDELTTLTVKIEQTILDLNHECEVAKDKAQQLLASNAAAPTDELRDLSISYRERIELLKPALASLKEEIANRNR